MKRGLRLAVLIITWGVLIGICLGYMAAGFLLAMGDPL